MVTGLVPRQRDRVGKVKGHSLISQRVCSMSHPTRQPGHTPYLLHSECADRSPIDFQDAVPRVDGIAVVGTDMHPVDPVSDRKWGRIKAS